MQANSLSGFLQVYAQESLKQFIAKAPLFSAWSTDFSPTIADGGLSVTTRLATTPLTANRTDINGYTPVAASASAVTMTLIQKDVTHAFSELQWATATPQVLLNTFLPGQIDSLVNTIAVDLFSNVNTGSGFLTSTGYITTSSIGTNAQSLNFNSASYLATVLDKQFVPRENRTLILCPDSHYGLIGAVNPYLTYGSTSAIQEFQATRVAGFAEYVYAGLKDSPYNVQAQSGFTNLFGIAAHKQGFAVAMRAPVEISNTLVQATTVSEPSSGISIQARISYIQATGQWQVSTTAIYATSIGNPNAIVVLT